MSEIVALPKSRRLWPWLLATAVIAGAGAWAIRSAIWPCGMLDSSSGCVQRVELDLSGMGLDLDQTRVAFRGFDLGPGGRTAVVGLGGGADSVTRGVMAVFDTATGTPIATLIAQEAELQDADPYLFAEAAFSPDGKRVAVAALDWSTITPAFDGPGPTSTLAIYDAVTGALIQQVDARMDISQCQFMLDFSPDGSKLQCGGTVYDLESGQTSSAYDANNMMLPLYADFPPGNRAPDGTVVAAYDLPSRTDIFDADASMIFAPDSVGLLEVWRAYRENRGQRWWTPAPFRYLSGVGVWDGKTKTLIRRFYANERYRAEAWARDGSHFGFVSDDLYLTVFQR